MFGVFGADINGDLTNFGEKERKKKKKKKHKHDASESDSEKTKHKKSKKSKKIKQEAESDKEDSKDLLRKAIKKEKKAEKLVKQVNERRKLSIVIKDLKYKSKVIQSSSCKSSQPSKDKDKERLREKEKLKEKERERKREKERRSRDIKLSGNVSDVSLSDEETYRKMLEYHTSSRWREDQEIRNKNVREWDRDKYLRGRSREDDRKYVFLYFL